MVTDRLAPFGQAVLAVRWGALAISLAVASPDIANGDGGLLAALLLLAAWTSARTLRPAHYDGTRLAQVGLALEVVVAVGAVTATGLGDSALVFALIVPAALGGFAGGLRLGLPLALISVLVVGLSWVLVDDDGSGELRDSAAWAGEVVLVAFAASYARRVSGEADERREATLDRLGRLSDANVLLFQLHQVTQTLPASLDLTEVLDTTVSQLRELFDSSGVAIVLREETDRAWYTVRRHGLHARDSYADAALPRPLARAVAVRSTDREDDLAPPAGPGLDPRSRSGLYGVLSTRGATIGVIALEDEEPARFAGRDVELLTGFVEAAALAIDNARWFGRLRTVGADEERARIAKDLHDRIGQSLAYLAFELDRIAKQSSQGKDVTASLAELRTDVRRVVSEVRDTLYDLRTDVTDSDGLASTLATFLQRVEARSGLRIELVAEETARLPLLRERELWRIAREALTNVERHAQATAVTVRWTCDGVQAELEVIDDGVGMATAGGGSLDGPGVSALRERAASIGATLAIAAEPGHGTRVRCTLAG